MYLRYFISFSIIAFATFIVLYFFFQDYSMSFTIATSVVAGAVYTFLASFGDKYLYKGILQRLLDKKKNESQQK